MRQCDILPRRSDIHPSPNPESQERRFLAYDCMAVNGMSLVSRPWGERYELCRRVGREAAAGVNACACVRRGGARYKLCKCVRAWGPAVGWQGPALHVVSSRSVGCWQLHSRAVAFVIRWLPSQWVAGLRARTGAGGSRA